MKVEILLNIIGAEFYTGVPDSQLKALCDHLAATYRNNWKHHVIAANEGNAVALAAGYHLSTGKIPVVYMQNSAEGNISLLCSIPGIDVAAAIIAEIGTDMSAFPDSQHICSWAGLSPGNNESCRETQECSYQ